MHFGRDGDGTMATSQHQRKIFYARRPYRRSTMRAHQRYMKMMQHFTPERGGRRRYGFFALTHTLSAGRAGRRAAS